MNMHEIVKFMELHGYTNTRTEVTGVEFLNNDLLHVTLSRKDGSTPYFDTTTADDIWVTVDTNVTQDTSKGVRWARLEVGGYSFQQFVDLESAMAIPLKAIAKMAASMGSMRG